MFIIAVKDPQTGKFEALGLRRFPTSEAAEKWARDRILHGIWVVIEDPGTTSA